MVMMRPLVRPMVEDLLEHRRRSFGGTPFLLMGPPMPLVFEHTHEGQGGRFEPLVTVPFSLPFACPTPTPTPVTKHLFEGVGRVVVVPPAGGPPVLEDLGDEGGAGEGGCARREAGGPREARGLRHGEEARRRRALGTETLVYAEVETRLVRDASSVPRSRDLRLELL